MSLLAGSTGVVHTVALSPRTWGGEAIGLIAAVLFVGFCAWIVLERMRKR